MVDHKDDPAGASEGSPSGQSMPTQAPRVRRTLIGPFSARQIGLGTAIVFGSALVLFLITRPLGSTQPGALPDLAPAFYQLTAVTQGLALGQQAPELGGDDGDKPVQLLDLDGHPVTLAALRGHPVWINFWATWCPPCQHETPVLRETYEAHKGQGLVLIAIDVQEEAGRVRQYAATYGLTYTIALDVTGVAFRTYRIFGLPSQYFIDRNGVIRGRYFGPLTRDLAD